jgi:hypothetical protein
MKKATITEVPLVNIFRQSKAGYYSEFFLGLVQLNSQRTFFSSSRSLFQWAN